MGGPRQGEGRLTQGQTHVLAVVSASRAHCVGNDWSQSPSDLQNNSHKSTLHWCYSKLSHKSASYEAHRLIIPSCPIIGSLTPSPAYNCHKCTIQSAHITVLPTTFMYGSSACRVKINTVHVHSLAPCKSSLRTSMRSSRQLTPRASRCGRRVPDRWTRRLSSRNFLTVSIFCRVSATQWSRSQPNSHTSDSVLFQKPGDERTRCTSNSIPDSMAGLLDWSRSQT